MRESRLAIRSGSSAVATPPGVLTASMLRLRSAVRASNRSAAAAFCAWTTSSSRAMSAPIDCLNSTLSKRPVSRKKAACAKPTTAEPARTRRVLATLPGVPDLLTVTVRDETTAGETLRELELQLLDERTTVRELIRARVHQEVRRH